VQRKLKPGLRLLDSPNRVGNHVARGLFFPDFFFMGCLKEFFFGKFRAPGNDLFFLGWESSGFIPSRFRQSNPYN
jgi:hypothetical protein